MANDLFDELPPDKGAEQDGATLVLRLHLRPGAGASAVTGRHGDALGLQVAPPPGDPRAAVAARRFLAELLSLETANVESLPPARGPSQRVALRGVDADVLRRQLDDAIAQANRPGGSARGVRPGR